MGGVVHASSFGAVDGISGMEGCVNVVEHRAPLRRIDFGLKPRAPESDPYAGYEVDRTAEIAEQDRIWRLVEQASRDGIGAPRPVPEIAVEEHLPACGGLADESLFFKNWSGA
jgi:hypothetical protein